MKKQLISIVLLTISLMSVTLVNGSPMTDDLSLSYVSALKDGVSETFTITATYDLDANYTKLVIEFQVFVDGVELTEYADTDTDITYVANDEEDIDFTFIMSQSVYDDEIYAKTEDGKVVENDLSVKVTIYDDATDEEIIDATKILDPKMSIVADEGWKIPFTDHTFDVWSFVTGLGISGLLLGAAILYKRKSSVSAVVTKFKK